MNYQTIRTQLNKIEGTQLLPVSESNAQGFLLPIEYELFLREVGAGRIGNSRFQFYDGVVFVDEIYGYTTKECEEILIFGDDYQGGSFGFDKSDWSIIRISADQNITKVANSFEDFIATHFS